MTFAAKSAVDTTITIGMNSQLIEDYIYSNEPPPLALSDRGGLLALGDGLLAVDQKQLIFFSRDTKSQTGWRTEPVKVRRPTTADDDRILSISGLEFERFGLRMAFAFCQFKAASGVAVSVVSRVGTGAWEPANLDVAAASFLSQVQQLEFFDAGQSLGWFVYGITTQMFSPTTNNAQFFTLQLAYSGGPKWIGGSQFEVSDMGFAVGTQPRVTLMSTGVADRPQDYGLAWWDMSNEQPIVKYGRVFCNSKGIISLPTSFFTAKFWKPLKRMVAMPFSSVTADTKFWQAIALDGDNLLWMHAFEKATDFVFSVRFGGKNAEPIDDFQYMMLPNGRINILATRVDTNCLRILRDAGNAMQAQLWADLGTEVKAIAVPNSVISNEPRESIALFYAERRRNSPELTYDVFHMSMDHRGEVWTVHKMGDIEADEEGIANGTIAPKEASSIAISLSVLSDGQPVGPTNIYVESDQWACLLVNQLSYWVGPGRSASFDTDGAGTVSIRYQAHSLKFPKLTFYAVDATRWCRGDLIGPDASLKEQWDEPQTTVAHRLAGKDPRFPLQKEMVTSKYNLVPSKSKPDDLARLTKMLNDTGDFMLAAKTGDFSEFEEPRVWRIQKTVDGFSCERLLTSPNDGIEPSSIFSDVWGDVTHYAKHILNEIKDWTVSLTKEGLKIEVWIGKDLVTGFAKTIEAAGDLVETIFAAITSIAGSIVDFIKKVVAFLEMLFKWKDILRTHDALSHFAKWIFAYGENQVEDLKSKIDQFLNKALAEFDDSINIAESYFEGGNGNGSINEFTSNNNNGGGNVNEYTKTFRSHLHNHSAQCQYAFHHTAAARPPGMPTALSAFQNKTIDDLTNHLANDKGREKAAQFAHGFSPQGTMSIQQILDSAIKDIFNVIKDLMKFAIEATEKVIDIILDALVDILKSTEEFLANPIHIPVISWIYKDITGKQLSLLDAGCLFFALPTTIIYKIFKDEAPFDDTNIVEFKKIFFIKDGIAGIDFDALLGNSQSATSGGSGYDWLVWLLELFSGIVAISSASFNTYVDKLTLKAAFEDEEVTLFWSGLGSILSDFFGNLLSIPLSVWVDWYHGKVKAVPGIAISAWWGLQFIQPVVDFLVWCKTWKTTRGLGAFPAIMDGILGCIIAGVAAVFIVTAAATGHSHKFNYVYIGGNSAPKAFRLLIGFASAGGLPEDAWVYPTVLVPDVLGPTLAVVNVIYDCFFAAPGEADGETIDTRSAAGAFDQARLAPS